MALTTTELEILYRELNPNTVFTSIEPSMISVTSDDIDNGYMERYFARKINNIYSRIIEINNADYIKVKNNPLYVFYNIRWRIRGIEDDVKKTNLNIARNADSEFYGIKPYLLGRLLAFYQK